MPLLFERGIKSLIEYKTANLLNRINCSDHVITLDITQGTYICLYVLPAKWIYQAYPFRLAQISPARNETRDEHKHLDRIYEKQICSYFLK